MGGFIVCPLALPPVLYAAYVFFVLSKQCIIAVFIPFISICFPAG